MTKDEGEPLSIGQVVQSTGEDGKVTLHRRGQQYVLPIGEHVAYTTGHEKICSIGRVVQVNVRNRP